MSFGFCDLFAGIGGMRLALESAGGICVFSSEWDKWAQRTYQANFGDVPAGDVTKIDARDIPDFRVLSAGFPCQPFSLAGVSKRISQGRSSGFGDPTQGTLFFDVKRIIAAKRPDAFLLENVKNLKAHDCGNTFRVIMSSLGGDLGYDVHHAVLDSYPLVPQRRERIFIVGFRRPARFSFPEVPRGVTALGDILEADVPDKYTLTEGTWNCMVRHAERHAAKGNGFGYWIASLDGPARTLLARYYKDGAPVLIPQEGRRPRRLTPRECARLMGFDDSFKIVCGDPKAYKQFGNSVVVPLVSLVAKAMVSAMESGDRPEPGLFD